METITLKISGMTCGGCSSSLTKLFESEAGIESVTVSHDDNQATLSYDPSKVSTDRFEEIIDSAGFELEE